MALNFCMSPVCPVPRPSESGFTLPILERGGDGFRMEESFDVVDLLPDDPFGMNVSSTLTAAIAGWIEDLKEECARNERGLDDQYDSIKDLNYYWNRAHFYPKVGFSGGSDHFCREDEVVSLTGHLSYVKQQFPSFFGAGDELLGSEWVEDWSSDSAGEWCAVDPCWEDQFSNCDSCMSRSDGFVWVPEKSNETYVAEHGFETEEMHAEGSSSAGGGEIPHDGMLFALGLLGVQDLLSVEMVCKTLHSAVRNDPFLWRCIHISQPLNERLTDEALLQLTKRADGNLQCLNLVDCTKITNNGLKHVLQVNGRITKLNLHGCGRLTVEGLVDSFRLFKTPGHPGIKHLMIGGIFASSEELYEDLISLLDLDITPSSKARKPRFYHVKHTSPSCDYDCALDMELCPKCQCLRLLYDCPAESCCAKIIEPCRACTICIPRCISCGRCIIDDEYEETFYLDYLCSACMNHLCKTQEGYEASFGKLAQLSPLLPHPSADQVTGHPVVE